ncbi:hypothetical protein BGZ54_010130 [Gamsiella multidivaricata]|nr:hypothetical protein BGZ54_010130 [Gamsiella multidivaricata]
MISHQSSSACTIGAPLEHAPPAPALRQQDRPTAGTQSIAAAGGTEKQELIEDEKDVAARGLTDEKHRSNTAELANIAPEDMRVLRDYKDEITEVKETEHGSDEPGHHRTLTDQLHGHRPDRHLFPYRSLSENVHAAKTFLRHFFFLFLIVPAWVIPNVLMAKAEHDLALSHGGGEGAGGGVGNETASHVAIGYGGLKFMTLSAAEEGGAEAHGPELSKAAYWVIFVLNLLVMMHLGKAAGRALEELVPKFGMRVVSVFDALTSSTVELAVASFALRKGLVVVVQAAMLGAILNNLLLETTQTSVNILMITCIAYVVPIGLESTLLQVYKNISPAGADQTAIRLIVEADILKLSKIMSVILLIVYLSCLFFQFHHETFMITPEAKHEGSHTLERRYAHFWFAGLAYVASMAAQIYSANLLVHAVEGLGRLHHLNDSFVGFVLLPIVLIADLQEEVIAIRESKANRLDRSVALMVGSCMQIALLVTPILVILGWVMDVPMTFKFTILEVVILATSVLLINYLIQDHETNWLAVFIMCAIAFFYDDSHVELISGEGTTISGDGVGGAPAALH